MTKLKGFNAEKYIEEQSEHILKRINEGESERLYLEFGGKLVHDKHAMRVLPGFDENAKIKLLQKMSDHAEIIICIYSGDILSNKTRQDFGITYDLEVMRLIDTFRKYGLSINSVVVTRYQESPSITMFMNKLERRGIKVYKHFYTEGYPTDVDTIVSDKGYGANPYIEVTKPLVVVTAPGGGSGKLATCLSQLYHEYKKGRKVRYAKFETFPIWNLPLKHPVNIAYEAATADLKDVNMIDNFHLDAYGELAVNYNRDLEAFPVVKRIIEKITGDKSEYLSPTDMGVNRAGFGIENNEICEEAAKQEIIRRFLIASCDYKKGKISLDSLERSELLMTKIGASVEDRKCVVAAREYVKSKQEEMNSENLDGFVIELADETMITGKSSEKMVAAGAAILNAIKYIADIDDETHLISPNVFDAMEDLKTNTLGQNKASLSVEDILASLAISATADENAKLAATKLKDLNLCKAHSTAILNDKDEQALKAMGIDVTSDPEFLNSNLYFI